MKLIDLTGKKYGCLTVVKRYGTYISPKGSKTVTWLCRCDCGNNTVVQSSSLKSGSIKSCGCKQRLRGFNETKEREDGLYIKVSNKEVVIDKEDLSLIFPYRVGIGKNGYAYTNRHFLVHKLVCPCKKGQFVDHINRNRLDNRKDNLRLVTPSESNMNRKATSNTGELGISHRKDGFYMVYVNKRYCGIRKTLEDAITLRNENLKGTLQATFNYSFCNSVARP